MISNNKSVFLLLELKLTDKYNLFLIFKTERVLFVCNGAHELHQRMGKAQGAIASDITPQRVVIAYKYKNVLWFVLCTPF